MSDTRELVELDLAHVWHPFTHHGHWGTEDEPVLIIERAEKNELIDTEGRRYFDAISSLWCNTLGHRVLAIDEAVRSQLDRFAHSTMLGLSSRPAVELARKLAELCPGDLDRVFYSDSGATAVEAALKIAAQHTRLIEGPSTTRTRFLALDLGYHGDTMGAVALGFTSLFHGSFAHLVFPVERLPSLDLASRSEGETKEAFFARRIAETVRAIHAAKDELCAVVVEPLVQGAAGMILQPPGYLAAVAKATRDAGALLVCDEVATGFWLTGARFACTAEAVVPDILCVAKGLSAGYLPLAATVVRPHVFEPFRRGTARGEATFFHGHTYTGNALASAAALAGLDLLEALAASGRIGEMALGLERSLAPLSDHPKVLELRQRGLMIGVELGASKQPRRQRARAT